MPTISKDNITYTITNFDEQNMVIFIDFNGEGQTAIALRDIPSSQEELDAIIKPFAPHVEVVQAKQAAKTVDLSFIRGRVGKKNKTGRFSQADHNKAIAAETTKQAANQANLDENGEPYLPFEDRVRKVVESILTEKSIKTTVSK